MATDFSSANYSTVGTATTPANQNTNLLMYSNTTSGTWGYSAPAAGSFNVQTVRLETAAADTVVCLAGYGDQ